MIQPISSQASPDSFNELETRFINATCNSKENPQDSLCELIAIIEDVNTPQICKPLVKFYAAKILKKLGQESIALELFKDIISNPHSSQELKMKTNCSIAKICISGNVSSEKNWNEALRLLEETVFDIEASIQIRAKAKCWLAYMLIIEGQGLKQNLSRAKKLCLEVTADEGISQRIRVLALCRLADIYQLSGFYNQALDMYNEVLSTGYASSSTKAAAKCEQEEIFRNMQNDWKSYYEILTSTNYSEEQVIMAKYGLAKMLQFNPYVVPREQHHKPAKDFAKELYLDILTDPMTPKSILPYVRCFLAEILETIPAQLSKAIELYTLVKEDRCSPIELVTQLDSKLKALEKQKIKRYQETNSKKFKPTSSRKITILKTQSEKKGSSQITGRSVA